MSVDCSLVSWRHIACVILACVLFLNQVTCHPQCTDSRPPFQAEKQLSFCPQYTDFGCCTGADDVRVSQTFERIKRSIPSHHNSLWGRCSNYVKTFLCQTCSPYAAHVFDSEVSGFGQSVTPRSFPGLCSGYCSTFYTECKDIVNYYMDIFGTNADETNRLKTAVQQGAGSFCSQVQLSDVDYCYPELLSNPILNGNISIETITKEGCICVEPIPNMKLRNPIFLKHANDGTNRLFIGEQIGLVHVAYSNGTKLPEPFIDIRSEVHTTPWKGDERGLLGMAFHPNYNQNGKFYLYYSTDLKGFETDYGDHKIRVKEYMVNSSNPNRFDTGYGRTVLEVYEPYWNHNGGEIMFGPDNLLYLFLGDGGKGGDPLQSGQNLHSLLGKALRIDVDNPANGTEYGIPYDNPFADGMHGRPEIYAYGIRNIWRCGMDRGDRLTGAGKGRIICGDVGQSAREELDLLEKGANYGWNIKEGTADYCPQCARAKPEQNLTAPVFDYPHSVGKSVTGGHFYRGCLSPNLNGFYIYGDFMSGKLFRLIQDEATKKWNNKELNMCGKDWCTPPLDNSYPQSIISFGEDEAGEIYMLSTSYASTEAFDGSVYRIVDPSRRGNPIDCGWVPPVPGTTPPVAGTTPPVAGTTPPVAGTTPVYPTQPTSTTKSTDVSKGDKPVWSDSRLESYVDYYKRQKRRNQRRQMQKRFKTQRQEQQRNRATYRGTPPPRTQGTLTFLGINVRRCSTYPTFWCSLNRLMPQN